MTDSEKIVVNFMIFKKATKNDEIFTVYLTLCSKCQIDGEEFVSFCGLLRKQELYSYAAINPINILRIQVFQASTTI